MFSLHMVLQISCIVHLHSLHTPPLGVLSKKFQTTLLDFDDIVIRNGNK